MYEGQTRKRKYKVLKANDINFINFALIKQNEIMGHKCFMFTNSYLWKISAKQKFDLKYMLGLVLDKSGKTV